MNKLFELSLADIVNCIEDKQNKSIELSYIEQQILCFVKKLKEDNVSSIVYPDATDSDDRYSANARKPPANLVKAEEQNICYSVAKLAPNTGMVPISSSAYIELYEYAHKLKSFKDS